MSCTKLYAMADEFICFDRPDSYAQKSALPIYEPGSIPKILGEELAKLDRIHDTRSPIFVASDWNEARAYLRKRLEHLDAPTLAIINQPSTGATELNNEILDFANHG